MEEKPFRKHFQQEKEEKKAKKSGWLFLFITVLVCCVLFGISYSFNQNYYYIEVEGKSMQPTINPNPVIVETTVGGVTQTSSVQDGVYVVPTKDIDYEDIIILENMFEEKKTIIKRALAFEGDYITIAKVENEEGMMVFRLMRVKSGHSEVEVLPEKYIKSEWEWATYYSPAEAQMPQDSQTTNIVYEIDFYETFSFGDYQERIFNVDGRDVKFFKVPEGELFYLGDNRTQSRDSTEEGTASVEHLLGKTVRIVRNGTYYSGNFFFFFNRLGEALSIIWDEILRFFGATI